MPRLLAVLLTIPALLLAPVLAQAEACTCYDANGDEVSVTGDKYCSDTQVCSDGGVDADGSCSCAEGVSLPYTCETICTYAKYDSEPPTSDTSAPTEYVRDPITPQLSVDIPDLTFTEPLQRGGNMESNFIGEYVSAVYKYLIGISVIIAIVFVMVGGVQYVLAAGTGDTAKAKSRIRNAVSGLVLLLCVYIILYTVNPNLTLFKGLSLTVIQREEIDNETPADFQTNFEVVSSPGNGGSGWNGVPMYDQKAYESTPYGPESCMKTGEGSTGNVKSSGCGVTAFAMVSSALGTRVTPDIVAQTFWDETLNEGKNFRPRNATTGCGQNGTASSAFTESRLVAQAGLRGRYISTGNTDEILDLLEQGKLLIVSYRTNSGGGHYVVLTGLDEDGNILINNPWGGTMEKTPPSGLFPALKSVTYIDRSSDFIP